MSLYAGDSGLGEKFYLGAPPVFTHEKQVDIVSRFIFCSALSYVAR